YNAQEYTQYAYDCSNVNGTKFATIQTTMDGRPNTDYILNCYNPNSTVNPNNIWVNAPPNFADDYRENLPWIKDTPTLNYSVYQTNWCHQDNWGVVQHDSKGWEDVQGENINDGFDLLQTGDHVYAIQATMPASQ